MKTPAIFKEHIIISIFIIIAFFSHINSAINHFSLGAISSAPYLVSDTMIAYGIGAFKLLGSIGFALIIIYRKIGVWVILPVMLITPLLNYFGTGLTLYLIMPIPAVAIWSYMIFRNKQESLYAKLQ